MKVLDCMPGVDFVDSQDCLSVQYATNIPAEPLQEDDWMSAHASTHELLGDFTRDHNDPSSDDQRRYSRQVATLIGGAIIDDTQPLTSSDKLHLLTFDDTWRFFGDVSVASTAYNYWHELVSKRSARPTAFPINQLQKQALAEALHLGLLRQKIVIDADYAANVAWRDRFSDGSALIDDGLNATYLLQCGELVPLIPHDQLSGLAAKTRKIGALAAMYFGVADMDQAREQITRDMVRVMARRTLATAEHYLGLMPSTEGIPPRWRRWGETAGTVVLRSSIATFSTQVTHITERGE